ncbi:MAG: WbqC family protein [Desulfobacterales bacterium]|nr:WbqC family protein [Desulfobacterales bacterium]
MIVSAYQPFFSPFPAFFYKAHLSDLMVILDDVQFPLRTTWITRNRFKNDQAPCGSQSRYGKKAWACKKLTKCEYATKATGGKSILPA